jgi:hypothetical protein
MIDDFNPTGWITNAEAAERGDHRPRTAHHLALCD